MPALDYGNSYKSFDKSNDDYIVEGSECGGAEIKGKRGTQEDRMQVGKAVPYFAKLANDELRKKCIIDTFASMNEKTKDHEAGSTAIISIACGSKIYTAGVGDAVSYLVYRNKKTNQIVHCKRLNEIHSPKDDNEIKRIINKGGQVTHGRIKAVPDSQYGGSIGVSRAFGDSSYKVKGWVTADPGEVKVHDILEPGYDAKEIEIFQVTACDGLTEKAEAGSPLAKKEIRSLSEGKNYAKDEAYIIKLFENSKAYSTLGNNGAKKIGLKQRFKQAISKQKKVDLGALSADFAIQAYNDGSEDNISVAIRRLNPEGNEATIVDVYDGHGGVDVSKSLADENTGFVAEFENVCDKQLNLEKVQAQHSTIVSELENKDLPDLQPNNSQVNNNDQPIQLKRAEKMVPNNGEIKPVFISNVLPQSSELPLPPNSAPIINEEGIVARYEDYSTQSQNTNNELLTNNPPFFQNNIKTDAENAMKGVVNHQASTDEMAVEFELGMQAENNTSDPLSEITSDFAGQAIQKEVNDEAIKQKNENNHANKVEESHSSDHSTTRVPQASLEENLKKLQNLGEAKSNIEWLKGEFKRASKLSPADKEKLSEESKYDLMKANLKFSLWLALLTENKKVNHSFVNNLGIIKTDTSESNQKAFLMFLEHIKETFAAGTPDLEMLGALLKITWVDNILAANPDIDQKAVDLVNTILDKHKLEPTAASSTETTKISTSQNEKEDNKKDYQADPEIITLFEDMKVLMKRLIENNDKKAEELYRAPHIENLKKANVEFNVYRDKLTNDNALKLTAIISSGEHEISIEQKDNTRLNKLSTTKSGTGKKSKAAFTAFLNHIDATLKEDAEYSTGVFDRALFDGMLKTKWAEGILAANTELNDRVETLKIKLPVKPELEAIAAPSTEAANNSTSQDDGKINIESTVATEKSTITVQVWAFRPASTAANEYSGLLPEETEKFFIQPLRSSLGEGEALQFDLVNTLSAPSLYLSSLSKPSSTENMMAAYAYILEMPRTDFNRLESRLTEVDDSIHLDINKMQDGENFDFEKHQKIPRGQTSKCMQIQLEKSEYTLVGIVPCQLEQLERGIWDKEKAAIFVNPQAEKADIENLVGIVDAAFRSTSDKPINAEQQTASTEAEKLRIVDLPVYTITSENKVTISKPLPKVPLAQIAEKVVEVYQAEQLITEQSKEALLEATTVPSTENATTAIPSTAESLDASTPSNAEIEGISASSASENATTSTSTTTEVINESAAPLEVIDHKSQIEAFVKKQQELDKIKLTSIESCTKNLNDLKDSYVASKAIAEILENPTVNLSPDDLSKYNEDIAAANIKIEEFTHRLIERVKEIDKAFKAEMDAVEENITKYGGELAQAKSLVEFNEIVEKLSIVQRQILITGKSNYNDLKSLQTNLQSWIGDKISPECSSELKTAILESNSEVYFLICKKYAEVQKNVAPTFSRLQQLAASQVLTSQKARHDQLSDALDKLCESEKSSDQHKIIYSKENNFEVLPTHHANPLAIGKKGHSAATTAAMAQYLSYISDSITSGYPDVAMLDKLSTTVWCANVLKHENNHALLTQMQMIQSLLVHNIAHDLMADTKACFRAIPKEEFLDVKNYENPEKSVFLGKLHQYINKISHYLEFDIVSNSDINICSEKIKRWIEIGFYCYKNQNYAAAYAIGSGLSSSAIGRLIDRESGSKSLILFNSFDIATQQKLTQLEAFISPLLNDKVQRELYEKTETAFVPFTAIFNRHLASLSGVSADMGNHFAIKKIIGRIERIQKLVKLADTSQNILASSADESLDLSQQLHESPKVSTLHSYMVMADLHTEMEAYNQSLSILPRGNANPEVIGLKKELLDFDSLKIESEIKKEVLDVFLSSLEQGANKDPVDINVLLKLLKDLHQLLESKSHIEEAAIKRIFDAAKVSINENSISQITLTLATIRLETQWMTLDRNSKDNPSSIQEISPELVKKALSANNYLEAVAGAKTPDRLKYISAGFIGAYGSLIAKKREEFGSAEQITSYLSTLNTYFRINDHIIEKWQSARKNFSIIDEKEHLNNLSKVQNPILKTLLMKPVENNGYLVGEKSQVDRLIINLNKLIWNEVSPEDNTTHLVQLLKASEIDFSKDEIKAIDLENRRLKALVSKIPSQTLQDFIMSQSSAEVDVARLNLSAEVFNEKWLAAIALPSNQGLTELLRQINIETKQAIDGDEKAVISPAAFDEIQFQILVNYFKTSLDDIVKKISAADPDNFSRLLQRLTQLEITFAKEGQRLDFSLPGMESANFTRENYKAELENARSLLEKQDKPLLKFKRLLQYQAAYDVIFKNNEFQVSYRDSIKPSKISQAADSINKFLKGKAGDPATVLTDIELSGIKIEKTDEFKDYLKRFAAACVTERKIDLKYSSQLNKISLKFAALGKVCQAGEELEKRQIDEFFSNLKSLLKTVKEAQTAYSKALKIPNLSATDLSLRINKMISLSPLSLDDYKNIQALFEAVTKSGTKIKEKDLERLLNGEMGFALAQLDSAIIYAKPIKELLNEVISNKASDLDAVNELLNKAHSMLSEVAGGRLDYTAEENFIAIENAILQLETQKAKLESAQSDRLSNTTVLTKKESEISAENAQENHENKHEKNNRLSEAEQSEVAEKLRNFIAQLEGAFLKNALIASTDDLIANAAEHEFLGADVDLISLKIIEAINELNAISSDISEIEPTNTITRYEAVLKSIGINIDLERKYAEELTKISNLAKEYEGLNKDIFKTISTASVYKERYNQLEMQLSTIANGLKEFSRVVTYSCIESLQDIKKSSKAVSSYIKLIEQAIDNPENLAELTKLWQRAQASLLAFNPNVSPDKYIASVRKILNAFAAIQAKVYQITSSVYNDKGVSLDHFFPLYEIMGLHIPPQGPVNDAQIKLLNELICATESSQYNNIVADFINNSSDEEADKHKLANYTAYNLFVLSYHNAFSYPEGKKVDPVQYQPETEFGIMQESIGEAIVQYDKTVLMAELSENKAKLAGPQQEKFSQSAQKHYAESLGQVISTYGDWKKDNSLEIYNIEAFTFKKADESPSLPPHVGSDGGIAVKDFSRKGSYNDIRIEDFHARGKMCFESAKMVAEVQFKNNPTFLAFLENRYKALEKEINTKCFFDHTLPEPAREKAVMNAYKNAVKIHQQFVVDLADSFVRFSHESTKANPETVQRFKKRDEVLHALKKHEQLHLQKVGRPDLYHIYKSSLPSQRYHVERVRDQVDVQLTMSKKTNPSHLRNGLGLANAVKEIQGHRIENSDQIKVDFVTYRGGEVPFDVSNIILRLAASEYNAKRMLEVMVADKIAIDPNNNAGTSKEQPLEISISSMTLLSTWVGNSLRGKTDEVRMVEESVLAWRMLKQKQDPIELKIEGKSVFVKFNVLEMNMAVKPIITKVTSEVEHNLNDRGYYQFAKQTETFLAGLGSNLTAKELADFPELKDSFTDLQEKQALISNAYLQASTSEPKLIQAEENLGDALKDHNTKIEALYKNLDESQTKFITLLGSFKEGDFEQIKDKKWAEKLKKYCTEYREIIDGLKESIPEGGEQQKADALAAAAKMHLKEYKAALVEIKSAETDLDQAYREVNKARSEIWAKLSDQSAELAAKAAELSAGLAKHKSTPNLDRFRKYCDLTQEYVEAQRLFYKTDAISGRKAYTKKENWYEFQARFIHIGYEMGNFTKFKCKSLEDRTGKLAETIKARSMFRQQEGRLPILGDKSDKAKLLEEHMTVIEAFSVSRENTHYNGWGARGKQTGTAHEKKMAKLDKGFYSWSKIKPLKLAKTLRSRMDFLSRKSVDTYSSNAKQKLAEVDASVAVDAIDLVERKEVVKDELQQLIDNVRLLARFINGLFNKAQGGNKVLVKNLEKLKNVLSNTNTIKNDLSTLKAIDTRKNPELKEHKRLAFKFEMLMGYAFSYLASELNKLKTTKNTENSIAQTRRHELLQACRPLLKSIKDLLDALPSNLLSKKANEYSRVVEAIDVQTVRADDVASATLNTSAGEVPVAELIIEEKLRIRGAEPVVPKAVDATLYESATSAKSAATLAAAILPEAVSNHIILWKNKIAELNKGSDPTQKITKGPLVKHASNITLLDAESERVHIEPIVHKGKNTSNGFDIDFKNREITYNNNKSSVVAGTPTKNNSEKADAKEMAYQLIKLGLSNVVVEIPQNSKYENFQRLLKHELSKVRVSQVINVTFKNATNLDVIDEFTLKEKTSGLFGRLHKNNESSPTPEPSISPSLGRT